MLNLSRAMIRLTDTTFEGIIYFLLNHRPNFKNQLIGAGIAKVTLDATYSTSHPVPAIERFGKF